MSGFCKTRTEFLWLAFINQCSHCEMTVVFDTTATEIWRLFALIADKFINCLMIVVRW